MERRRELRQAAEGTVELEVGTAQPRVVVGELIDISSSGFRVRHGDLALATGDKVRYSHSGGAGAALVMWTRVFEGRVESGLYTGPA
jgi:hypothetical protein